MGRQYVTLTGDLEQLRKQLDGLVQQANPGLLQAYGVGPDTAGSLLVAAGGNPERMTSEVAFAALCGVAPVDASSGKTSNHRLSRGGNREANNALWRIAMVRMQRDPQTQAYVARRTAEGLSKRAIVRCLKRFIAREIYHHLVHPVPAVRTDDLRARRQQLHLPLRVPAAELGITEITISRLERGLDVTARHVQRYQTWPPNKRHPRLDIHRSIRGW